MSVTDPWNNTFSPYSRMAKFACLSLVHGLDQAGSLGSQLYYRFALSLPFLGICAHTLQVLISIQSMILCEEPYLNEPGWGNDGGTPQSRQCEWLNTSDDVRLCLWLS